MTKVKVTAPNSEYSSVGPAGVQFRDGVADYDDAVPEHRAALAYFREHGYGVGDTEPEQPEQERQPDSRDVGGTRQLGTALRDAAVNPKPGDFLVPTNAGQADPHGPEVVAPGVHALPPGPIVPGPVSDNPARQDTIEAAVTEAVLVQQGDVGQVTQAAAAVNPQPGPSVDENGPAEADYDPANYTVPDVLAYIEQADRDEALRVLDLEAKGKARSTVLAARDGVEAREH